ncbi:MAG: hypothetical protein Q8S39_11805 [Ignavibacteria bacterium]|nr:hypothetical protein [Ignavibacteria bacterium]
MPKLVIKLRSLLFHLLFYTYIGFSLLSLENCTKGGEDSSTADRLVHNKDAVVKLMLQEFDAQVFDCSTQNIFSRPVVVDTTLMSISRNGEDVFLSAQVNLSCAKKYFVKLKCSQEVLEQYNKTKSNNAIIAARFTRMDNEELIANADSLDGTNPTIHLGETVILSGECLAIKEIPSVENAD